MNFELKEYYNLDDNATNDQVIDEHLKRNLECIKWINENVSELLKEENVFPEYNWEMAKTIQALTIGTCVLVFNFSNNPTFLIEAENFIDKKSLITFDVFVFFLEIFINKIKTFKKYNIDQINQEISNYQANKNNEYNLNLTALYRIKIDTQLFVTILDDQIIKYKF